MRNSLIEAEIKDLMSGEFNQFKINNFVEAMQNLPIQDYIMLSAAAETASKLSDNSEAQKLLSGYFIKYITKYWREIAEHKAEQIIPGDAELHQQEIEYQRDIGRKSK